jgi:4-carboxymuconolactone decarboxylase
VNAGQGANESPRRLAKLAPAELDAIQRAVYDSIAAGPRAQGPQLFQLTDADGRLEGPFNAFLVQPRLGGALQALGAAVRYQTELPDRAREIAILVVARHWRSAFEWYAHEAVARHVGLSDGELQALNDGHYEAFSPPEALVAQVAAELVATGDLVDPAYEQAVTALGEAGVFELTTLVGYYATLALQLRVFRVPLPGAGPP